MSAERTSGEILGVLDLMRAADKAEADGNTTLANQLREDAGDMVDHGNATTYAELAMGSLEIDPGHPDYALIQSIAEQCALSGMRHARMERSERNRRPRDGLVWFALKQETRGGYE